MDVKRPVIILGCPRSGTLLLSRIIGGYRDFFLITEHSHRYKKSSCPEDISGVIDHTIWWDNFEYEGWDEEKKRPLVDEPIYNKENIAKVRKIYLSLAQGKRLVIKNPTHIVKINILKEMFPGALFVFAVRNPWHTLQSMTIKGNDSFIVRSKLVMSLPDDLLLKASYTWKESIDNYLKEKDENWIAIRYEDVVSDTLKTLKKLFDFVGIDDEGYLVRVTRMVNPKKHNYYHIKRLFKKSKYKKEIIDALRKGSEEFNYSLNINSIQSSAIEYYKGMIKKKLKVFKA